MNFLDFFKGFYKGKRVLVTGHTGFKGSWLIMWLNLLGAEVIGYSLEPVYDYNMFDLCGLNKGIVHIIGDIRDNEKLHKTILEYKPEIVFHLAAQALVRASYKEPYYTFDTNIMGTVNLYESIRATDTVNTIITVTSDKCYENKEFVYGYREIDPMGGDDPYSSSKGCVELITASYRKSFFDKKDIAISTVRAGNVIGGGDWSNDRLIPDCVRAINNNEEIVLRNPHSVRPWQHVLEPLSGYLWLGVLMYENQKKYSSCWNFGPEGDDNFTVEKIVRYFIDKWQKGSYSVDNSNHPHEASQLNLDISKAKFYLGWKPIFSVSEAIEKTVNWYKEFYFSKNKSLNSFSVKQLNEYCKKAKEKKLCWTI